ncbi:hypothetical protein MKW94_006195 [Papaver nudicaule]|uniref:Zinc-ribbon domain-containing protein n=1 Tax=Papaver nudicaule TaxID=74823 RepID=A0AA42B5A5_PAPNU|nr:hypothetical protein [Papaver nudicaule]
MEEESNSSKLRLVRCPKCENLLPELQNVPVYQCGGCGAVLQAKKQLVVSNNGISSNGSSEKSVEVVGIRVGTEKLDEKKGDSDLSTKDTSDLDSTNGGGVVVESKLNVLPDKPEMKNVVVSRNVSGESSNNVVVDAHVGQNREELIRVNIVESRERDRSTAYRRTPRFVVEDVSFSSRTNEEEVGGFKPSVGVANGYGRAEHVNGYKERERDDAAYRRVPRVVVDDVNFSGCSYPSEGPSNYQPGSSYGNGENHVDGVQDRVEFLEQDRAELLRKLDELKEQLTKSCEVSEKAKQRVPLPPPPPYAGQTNRLPNNGARPQQVFSQPFSADEHIRNPPYVSHVHEHVPMMHGHEMDMQNFYAAHVNVANDRRGHGDLFGPNMPGRAPNRQRREYPQQSSNGYYSGHFIDSDPELISPYPHNNTFFHQPECPCSHCYNKSWLPPSHGLPMSFPHRRFADGPGNSAFYHLDEPRAYDPWGYNRSTNLPLHSQNPHMQKRRKNDHDTETGGFGRDCALRVPLAKRNGQHCLPIAGGAPFITCSNCFQLLPLPKKLLQMEKNRQQLRCGSCSSVMSISFEDKKLVITVPTQIIEVPLETNDSSDQVLDGAYRGQVNYYSDDYDTAGCNFLPMDEMLNSGESEKMQGNLTSSSGTFEDDGSPESMIAQQEASSSTELPKKVILSPTLTGSPVHEHYDQPTDQLVSKFGKGNMSKRTDQEKIVVARAASRQNSLKDGMLATEMEISFNDYTNNGVCHSSKEANKEEDRPRNGKSGNSFLAGLIKKSFKSNQSRENDGVFVNGQLISDRLVKKAEKQAGPIRPGSYWYDSRAGFWGVMGQHCLGIIPPCIEEFSCPIPRNCSSGDTGVLVNGRELHQKDLDLLASRGLPTESDKSYIVEISGRILDEDTGEELDSLGKLAPTVERMKRGFGMRALPSVTA